MKKHDSLGDRMKEQYENRTRYMLPRRTHTLVRLDGKAFHTYTRGRQRPWDKDFHQSMTRAALALCSDAQGAVLAYVQSDEISLLLTDFKDTTTEAWFDNNLQKITSVSASIATLHFNKAEETCFPMKKHAYFDSRAFTIPDPTEVHNYFVWRQKDCERNSLSMLAQHYFSQRELHGKNRDDMHDMLHGVGVNWNDQEDSFKRGSVVIYREKGWEINAAPIFTQNMDYVLSLIEREDKA